VKEWWLRIAADKFCGRRYSFYLTR